MYSVEETPNGQTKRSQISAEFLRRNEMNELSHPGARRVPRMLLAASIALTFAFVACGGGSHSGPAASPAAGLGKINHLIVIYQENWSFDGLYGNFPGANGL